MKPSPKTMRALRIIRYLEPSSAANFARLMWPYSIMHTKVSNQGHGATRGKTAWLCGGSYLAKLQAAGLISVYRSLLGKQNETPVAYLTRKGEKILKGESR